MVKHICPTCNKNFDKKSTFLDHLNRKNPCQPSKVNDTNQLNNKYDILAKKFEELEKKNKELEKEVKKLKKEKKPNIVSNSNNINSNNVNNTMNILVMPKAYGKEDYDLIIDDATLRKILTKGFQSIPELIKKVHFNESLPEYQNLILPNWRDKVRILISDGKNWNLSNTETVVADLKEKGIEFIQRKYDELDKNNKEDAEIIKKVSRFIDSYNLEEQDKIDMLNEEIRLVLYNNRKIPENTRKKIETAKKIKN